MMPYALIDMDGTVADYDAGYMRDMEPLCSREEWIIVKHLIEYRKDLPNYIEARRQMITRIPGWWRTLPRLEAGFYIVDKLVEFGFQLEVLTQGPATKSRAWMEKVDWCAEHLPDVPVTITRNKAAHYGRILVDDYPPFMEAWLEQRPRGLGIMVAQQWNRDFKHSNIFRYDHSKEEHKLLLEEVIKLARDRKDGETLNLESALNKQ